MRIRASRQYVRTVWKIRRSCTWKSIPKKLALWVCPSIPSIPENLKSYVTYTVTYSDGGTALNANDTLAHGATKKVKVRLEFKKDIAQLPTAEDPLALSFTLNYVQK